MKPRQRAELIELLNDPEYRHEFFGSLMSATIAAQIKANRTDRGWSQSRLGRESGMRQPRISAMEDVNYEKWNLGTLRRLAKAFDVTLSVRFESFGKALACLDIFQESLVEEPYERDALLHGRANENNPAVGESSATLAPVVDFFEYSRDLSPKTAGSTETAEGQVEYA